MRRLFALFAVSLAIAFMIACGDERAASEGAGSTSVPPTFVRVAVTASPTESPVPTPAPTATPEPQQVNTGPPEFPLELDPDLVEDRPTDEVIFAGWTEFLHNTEVHYAEFELPLHLCSNGVIVREPGSNGNLENWRVTRSPAVSSYDWGTVSIEVDIVRGRWAGRHWAVLTVARFDNGFVVTNNYRPGPVEFTRSEECLTL
jgi:hypothetical protein